MPKRYKRYYKLPLRSRADIAAFLLDDRSYNNGYGERSLLSWTVKCYTADFSFDHLLETYKKDPGGDVGKEQLEDPLWVALARREYKESEEYLWDAAVERARESVIDDDTHKVLAYGPQKDYRVEWEFAGRSGGHLLLKKFNGYDFTDNEQNWEAILVGPAHTYKELVPFTDPAEIAKAVGIPLRSLLAFLQRGRKMKKRRHWEIYDKISRANQARKLQRTVIRRTWEGCTEGWMPWKDLYELYTFVVQCDHDFTDKAIREELEYNAAWALFENACRKLDHEVAEIRQKDRERAITAGLAGCGRSAHAAA